MSFNDEWRALWTEVFPEIVAQLDADEETCEFCLSNDGPVLSQDLGDGRSMRLCPRCRAYIEEGRAAAGVTPGEGEGE